MARRLIDGGSFRLSSEGMRALMCRTTTPTSPRCRYALSRKRPMPSIAIARSHSSDDSKSRICDSRITEYASRLMRSAESGSSCSRRTAPCTLMAAAVPLERNRSDAPWATMADR